MDINILQQTNYRLPTCLDIVSTIVTSIQNELKNEISDIDLKNLIVNIKNKINPSDFKCNQITCPTCSTHSTHSTHTCPVNEKTIIQEEKIHPLVNQIGLDENLILNIKDIVDKTLNKKANYFPDIQVNSDADLDSYVVINKTNIVRTRFEEIFAQPKQIITDVTSNLFFSEEKYLNFISKFIQFMERLIDNYCQRKQSELNKKFLGCKNINGLIIFVFKGGNLLKGYFQKYTSEQPGVVSEFIRQIYGKHFKNSDLDFQIVIHPKLHDKKNIAEQIYEIIYNDLMKLTYLALNRWRNYILSDISSVVNFYQLNSHTKKNILTECKDKINQCDIFDVNLKDENGAIIGDVNAKKQWVRERYRDEDDIFVGAEIENLQFYNCNTDPDVYDEYLRNNNNPDFLKQKNPATPQYDSVIDKINNTYQEHLKSFQRADFYITTKKYNGFIYTLSQKLYKSDIELDENKQSNIYPDNDIKSELYITVNNFINIRTHDATSDSNFGLCRLRFNTIGYIKFQDQTRGMLNIPGEFIDISISKFSDNKTSKIYDKNILDYYYRYTFKNINLNINIPEFQFWSYNLHGFISDLYLILYDDNKYPWYDIKYIKRFERLFILGIYQLLFINNENSHIIRENIKLIKKTFKLNYNDLNLIPSLKNILDIFNEFPEIVNSVLYKIIATHIDIVTNLNAETDTSIKTKHIDMFNKYKAICNNNWSNFDFILRKINDYVINRNIGHVNSDRMVEMHQLGGSYYEKYIKYKQKYLNSKKN